MLKVGGHSRAPPSGELLSHTKTSYPGTKEFMRRWARVARYNNLFTRFIITRRCGVGGVFLPWGKGLSLYFIHLG